MAYLLQQIIVITLLVITTPIAVALVVEFFHTTNQDKD